MESLSNHRGVELHGRPAVFGKPPGMQKAKTHVQQHALVHVTASVLNQHISVTAAVYTYLSAGRWVQRTMANGFKSPSGILAIAGLMGLPLWLWAKRLNLCSNLPCYMLGHTTVSLCCVDILFVLRFMPGSLYASPLLGALVIVGRLLCASVEVWVRWAHVAGLLKQDEADCHKSSVTQASAKQS